MSTSRTISVQFHIHDARYVPWIRTEETTNINTSVTWKGWEGVEGQTTTIEAPLTGLTSYDDETTFEVVAKQSLYDAICAQPLQLSIHQWMDPPVSPVRSRTPTNPSSTSTSTRSRSPNKKKDESRPTSAKAEKIATNMGTCDVDVISWFQGQTEIQGWFPVKLTPPPPAPVEEEDPKRSRRTASTSSVTGTTTATPDEKKRDKKKKEEVTTPVPVASPVTTEPAEIFITLRLSEPLLTSEELSSSSLFTLSLGGIFSLPPSWLTDADALEEALIIRNAENEKIRAKMASKRRSSVTKRTTTTTPTTTATTTSTSPLSSPSRRSASRKRESESTPVEWALSAYQYVISYELPTSDVVQMETTTPQPRMNKMASSGALHVDIPAEELKPITLPMGMSKQRYQYICDHLETPASPPAQEDVVRPSSASTDVMTSSPTTAPAVDDTMKTETKLSLPIAIPSPTSTTPRPGSGTASPASTTRDSTRRMTARGPIKKKRDDDAAREAAQAQEQAHAAYISRRASRYIPCTWQHRMLMHKPAMNTWKQQIHANIPLKIEIQRQMVFTQVVPITADDVQPVPETKIQVSPPIGACFISCRSLLKPGVTSLTTDTPIHMIDSPIDMEEKHDMIVVEKEKENRSKSKERREAERKARREKKAAKAAAAAAATVPSTPPVALQNTISNDIGTSSGDTTRRSDMDISSPSIPSIDIFDQYHTYASVKLSLSRPLVPIIPKPQLSPHHIIPPRVAPVKPRRAPRDELRHQLHAMIEHMAKLYTSAPTDDKRSHIMYELNASGMYRQMKELLKPTFVRLVRDGIDEDLSHGVTRENRDRVLTQLHTTLMSEMHRSMNEACWITQKHDDKSEAATSPCPNPHPHIHESPEHLLIRAYEAEMQQHMERTHTLYKQRCEWEEHEPNVPPSITASYWYDYALFCLRSSQLAEAQQCLHTSISIDSTYVPSLLAMSVFMMGHVDYIDVDKVEIFTRAALTIEPNNVIANALQGICYDLIDEPELATQAYNTAESLLYPNRERKNQLRRLHLWLCLLHLLFLLLQHHDLVLHVQLNPYLSLNLYKVILLHPFYQMNYVVDLHHYVHHQSMYMLHNISFHYVHVVLHKWY